MINSELSSLRVLYAEDEAEIRDSVTMILRRRLKSIVAVSNGKEALEAFDKDNVDVLITDLQMPVMNGQSLAKQIKEASPETPIIVMSAYNDDSHHVPQATCTVYKPIVKNDLLSALEKCASIKK